MDDDKAAVVEVRVDEDECHFHDSVRNGDEEASRTIIMVQKQ